MTATKKDVENIEAWAELVADLIELAPFEIRLNILQLARTNEINAAAERVANGGFTIISGTEMAKWGESPACRNWNVMMRLKSLAIQVFVRDITNNHSADDAAKILFSHQRFGHGSGDLSDYLDDLPRS